MEFLKNFFRDSMPESSTRLVLVFACFTSYFLCVLTTIMFFITGKDFSSQCAVLSGILLTVPSILKGMQNKTEKL